MKLDKIEYQEIVDYTTSNCKKAIANIPVHLEKMESLLPEKLKSSKISPVKKLARLYEAMDIMAEYFDGFTACSSGCSNCCHYPVTVSSIEADFIKKNEKIRFNKNPPENTPSKYKGVPCVFLKGGRCSIYKSRPFACRNMVSMAKTDKICDVRYAFDNNLPMLAQLGFKKSYDMIRIESGDIHAPFDIRDLFKAI
jgi:Fe-S-cluster containining protein